MRSQVECHMGAHGSSRGSPCSDARQLPWDPTAPWVGARGIPHDTMDAHGRPRRMPWAPTGACVGCRGSPWASHRNVKQCKSLPSCRSRDIISCVNKYFLLAILMEQIYTSKYVDTQYMMYTYIENVYAPTDILLYVYRRRVVQSVYCVSSPSKPTGCRCGGCAFDRSAGSPPLGHPPAGTIPYPPEGLEFAVGLQRVPPNTLYVGVVCLIRSIYQTIGSHSF